MEIIRRQFSPPEHQSYFLFGPRGTGKSQLLGMIYPHAKFLDLLDDKTQIEYSVHPERLEPLVLGMKDDEVLVIDEVQRAPQLLSKIHQLIEDKKYPRITFILTGSSSRKLKRMGVDLLGGRAVVKTLHPFTVKELGETFNLESALNLGMIPLILGAKKPNDTLNSYIALYLKEEVKQERVVQHLESFYRFLEAMAFSHGEVLNLSNVSRDCGVKRSTCDGHLSILEDLLLGYRIPPFKIKNRKQTIESEKFYYFDCGVFNALRPRGPLDDKSQRIGQALEGFIEQNLRAWISYRNRNEKIYFWRTRAGNEVDFIIYGEDLFEAIEVKNTKKISREDLSGLNSFLDDYPQAKAILVFRGENTEQHGKITCVPVEKFLQDLKFV